MDSALSFIISYWSFSHFFDDPVDDQLDMTEAYVAVNTERLTSKH